MGTEFHFGVMKSFGNIGLAKKVYLVLFYMMALVELHCFKLPMKQNLLDCTVTAVT